MICERGEEWGVGGGGREGRDDEMACVVVSKSNAPFHATLEQSNNQPTSIGIASTGFSIGNLATRVCLVREKSQSRFYHWSATTHCIYTYTYSYLLLEVFYRHLWPPVRWNLILEPGPGHFFENFPWPWQAIIGRIMKQTEAIYGQDNFLRTEPQEEERRSVSCR